MNQKKLKSTASEAGKNVAVMTTQVYTGTIDCLVQVCLKNDSLSI